MNTFGSLFKLTTFGESHGPALGAVLDGCPAGVLLGVEDLQRALDRRRPGQSALVSGRAEADRVEILSGVFEGKTLGTPIAAIVRNQDARSADYDPQQQRAGHADAVWQARFQHRDHRGGGRSSGRETLSRVIGGAIAEALFRRELPEVTTVAWVSRVGPLGAKPPHDALTRAEVDLDPVRCPDGEVAPRMADLIGSAKASGDSLGGTIDLLLHGLPAGLGEPVFGKLKARLAEAMAGVGAVTGVVWGPEDLPAALAETGKSFHTRRESYSGIQGGMATGEPIHLRVFFKPPSTLGDMARQGRHDPCILPRAVPVLEAMASLVLADLWLHLQARSHRA